jgi:hypothetical protein
MPKMRRGIVMATDVIIRSAEEVFLCDTDTGQLTPLADDTGAQVPVKFDAFLVEYMQFDEQSCRTARQIVSRLFGGNELAVGHYSGRLQKWMTDTSKNANADFLGED